MGVERWEIGTLLFPTLTDGTPCPIYSALPAQARAPFADDAALAKARDWFIDDGAPVTEPMTADDGRYALAYVRRVVDVALAFGAKPYVDIDAMPRALSVNRTFARDTAALSANDACSATFTNHVTNAAPASASVFAAAVTGLVRRVVEGSNGEPGRPVTRWELWNEPEWPFFWDKAFEPNKNLDAFFGAMTAALFRLDAYRKSSPAASALRFGLGSFASADTAAKVLAAYDGKAVPVDFVSFHAYDNDPLVIVAQLAKVASARAATKDYKSVELVLAEWGPQLDGKGWDPATMDVPLLVSTVIALGAPLGVARMHHALFWDYYDVGVRYGLLDHDVKPKPLHSAYSLLARAIGAGASRLAPKGLEDGRIDGGAAAVLASKDGSGKLHVVVINRGAAAKDVELRVAGVAVGRVAVSRLEGQGSPPRSRRLACAWARAASC